MISLLVKCLTNHLDTKSGARETAQDTFDTKSREK